MQETDDPEHQHQQCTEPGVHDGNVVRGVTATKGSYHHGQEKDVQYYKECEKIHLGDADFIGDNFALAPDVPQHLCDGGRR